MRLNSIASFEGNHFLTVRTQPYNVSSDRRWPAYGKSASMFAFSRHGFQVSDKIDDDWDL